MGISIKKHAPMVDSQHKYQVLQNLDQISTNNPRVFWAQMKRLGQA